MLEEVPSHDGLRILVVEGPQDRVGVRVQKEGHREAAAIGGLLWQYTAGVVAIGVLAALFLGGSRDRGLGAATAALLITGVALAASTLRQQLAHRTHLLGEEVELWSFLSPFELLGYCLLGGSPWDAVLGLLLALWLFGQAPRELARLALLPAGLVLGLAVAGLHPFGGIRQCLILTPGLLLAGAHSRFRLGPLFPVGLAGALVVQVLRYPGVPLWDLPTLVERLEAERSGEPIWVDPRLGLPWTRYAPELHADRGTWDAPSAPEGSPLWVITTESRPATGAGLPAKQLRAEGVRATLWISGE